jgi:hypothetical protein
MANECGHGGEEDRRRRRGITYLRPGASLANMARQCPRSRPGAARGWLHRWWHRSTGSTHRGRFHRCRPATATTAIVHHKHHESHWWSIELEGDQSRRNPIQRWQGISQRGGDRQIQLEEGLKGIEVHRLPHVAVTEVVRGGRSRQAMAEAIRVCQRDSRGRGVRVRGWTGSVWPI